MRVDQPDVPLTVIVVENIIAESSYGENISRGTNEAKNERGHCGQVGEKRTYGVTAG